MSDEEILSDELRGTGKKQHDPAGIIFRLFQMGIIDFALECWL